MAHQEACQVFIEQEIDKGLKAGKTPYSIGKDLTVWLEKLFEAKIPPTTIEKRAERIRAKIPTNVGSESTQENHSGKNQEVPIKDSNPTIQAPKEDSDALFQLKRWWKRATKKDRKSFLDWVNKKEGGK